eukprot:364343_1
MERKEAFEDAVVKGFIRTSQKSFANNVIIPIEIIQICCKFYKKILKLFLFSSSRSWDRKHGMIHELDTKFQVNTNISNPHQSQSNHLMQPFIYIENISSMMSVQHTSKINSNKSYDGIVAVKGIERQNPQMLFLNGIPCFESAIKAYHPCIMLFDNTKMDNNNNMVYHTFISSTPVDSNRIHQFVHCGTNGIVHEYGGYLYRLNLTNLNLTSFAFEPIHGIYGYNVKFVGFINPNSHDSVEYLSMSYLENTNKIFAIKNAWNSNCAHTEFSSSQQPMVTTEKYAKCGIFDFEKYEWKYIADCKYTKDKRNEHGFYQHESCHNSFNRDVLHVVSDKGHTATYDFNKNMWKTMADNCLNLGNTRWKKHLVWMDSKDILCCSDGRYFGYFDIRNNNTWNKMDSYYQILQTQFNHDPDCYKRTLMEKNVIAFSD